MFVINTSKKLGLFLYITYIQKNFIRLIYITKPPSNINDIVILTTRDKLILPFNTKIYIFET